MSDYENTAENYAEDRQSEVIFAAQEAEKQLDLFEMDNESGLKYFQERYSKSFTEDDEQFQECLNKKLGNPPIMMGYRIFQNARRNRNNYNHNNNYNQRR